MKALEQKRKKESKELELKLKRASKPAKTSIRQSQTKKSRSSVSVERVCKRKSQSQKDDERCELCGYSYGDINDSLLEDEWESCIVCKLWWHETCSDAQVFINKQCKQCQTQQTV